MTDVNSHILHLDMSKYKKANNQKTIAFVVNNQLCTGCGTCAGTCPQEAISMAIDIKKGIYLPQISEKCNNCGFCVKVCPGHEVDFIKLNQEIFGKQPDDILLGNYLNCYTGYSTDEEIRYNSSSGGMVTQLLIFALEQGIIDGALVTRMKKDKPLDPESFIARTREEIISARGSKYCPVPANVALREILNAKESEKFAVVGLPCHMHGVKKAVLINEHLRSKIILFLGLYCSHTDTFNGTKYLLKRFSIKEEGIKSLKYRGNGWPGYLTIDFSNCASQKVHFYDYIDSHTLRFFAPRYCMCCPDAANELCDITFLDAWSQIVRNDNTKGASSIIIRTSNGKKAVDFALKSGYIELASINRSDILTSQANMEYSRKDSLIIRKIFQTFRLKVPNYLTKYLKITISNYIRIIVILFNYFIGSILRFYVIIDIILKVKFFIKRRG